MDKSQQFLQYMSTGGPGQNMNKLGRAAQQDNASLQRAAIATTSGQHQQNQLSINSNIASSTSIYMKHGQNIQVPCMQGTANIASLQRNSIKKTAGHNQPVLPATSPKKNINTSELKSKKSSQNNKSYNNTSQNQAQKESLSLGQSAISCGNGPSQTSKNYRKQQLNQNALVLGSAIADSIENTLPVCEDVYRTMSFEKKIFTKGGQFSNKNNVASEGPTHASASCIANSIINDQLKVRGMQERATPTAQPSWGTFSAKHLKQLSPSSVGVLSQDHKYGSKQSTSGGSKALTRNSRLKGAIVGMKSPKNCNAGATPTSSLTQKYNFDFLERAQQMSPATSIQKNSGNELLNIPRGQNQQQNQHQNSGKQSSSIKHLTSTMSALMKRQTLSSTDLQKNLHKAISLKTLGQQRADRNSPLRAAKKKSPQKERGQVQQQNRSSGKAILQVQQRVQKQQTTAAGIGKYQSTPRNQTIALQKQHTTQNQQQQNTCLVQRHMSIKLLSPMAMVQPNTTQSRQQSHRIHGVVSSPVGNQSLGHGQLSGMRITESGKKTVTGEFSRPKTQLKQAGIIKNQGMLLKNSQNNRLESAMEVRTKAPFCQNTNIVLAQNSRQNNTLKLTQTMQSKSNNIQTLSCASKISGTSSTSHLIKAPSQLAFHSQHKTILSDKIPAKLSIADRPKTTMLVQLQQNLQPNNKFNPISSREHYSRVLSPSSQQQHQQLIAPYLNRNTSWRIGYSNPQRLSGDLNTLQSYRQTTQSSLGLLQTVRSSQGLCSDKEVTQKAETKRGPLTQPRRSTTATKISKSSCKKNLLGSKSHSMANTQQRKFCHKRRGSTKKDSGSKAKVMEEEIGEVDDMYSSRSGRTQVIDEVLHQQKTEAYRELQRKCETMLAHNNDQNKQTLFQMPDQTVAAASEMGRIIEQEDDVDISIDKADVAQELETTGMEQHLREQMTTEETKAGGAWSAGSSKGMYPTDKKHNSMPFNSEISNQLQTQKINGRAKTNVHLVQELRIMQEMEMGKQTKFSNRKQSNDTVVVTKPKDTFKESTKHKNSLATLLKPVTHIKNQNETKKNINIYTKGIKSQNATHEFGATQETPPTEPFVNSSSYMTGHLSATHNSQKPMQSSRSAKDIIISCSLGPKSTLKQAEQVNADNAIKILVQNSNSLNNNEASLTVEHMQTTNSNLLTLTNHDEDSKQYQQQQNTQLQQSTDQQGLNTPTTQQNINSSTKKVEFNKQILNSPVCPFGPKKKGNSTGMKNLVTNKDPHDTNSKPNLAQKITNESFKSTLVDFTESMNENRIMKITIEQSREMLLYACRTGDLISIKKIPSIKQFNGIDLVNFRAQSDPSGMTPLHLACQTGHVEVVEALIRKFGANVDMVNDFGETALHIACREGHKGVIERLLLARAQTKVQEKLQGNTPLHVLALSNHQRDMTTIFNDSIKLTMNSHPRRQEEEVRLDSDQQEQIETNDFMDRDIDHGNSLCPRQSLIEVVLPFAEESKSIKNSNGVLPWQLAVDIQIANLLKPADLKLSEGKVYHSNQQLLSQRRKSIDDQAFTQLVTASQIQGQSTNHLEDRRNNTITRNHKDARLIGNHETAMIDNKIEVKQVSESDVAKIFTFFDKNGQNDQKPLLSYDKLQQFTFQEPMLDPIDAAAKAELIWPERMKSQVSSEMYISQNSKNQDQKYNFSAKKLLRAPTKDREQITNSEVRKHQDYLDEDIQRIDYKLEKNQEHQDNCGSGFCCNYTMCDVEISQQPNQIPQDSLGQNQLSKNRNFSPVSTSSLRLESVAAELTRHVDTPILSQTGKRSLKQQTGHSDKDMNIRQSQSNIQERNAYATSSNIQQQLRSSQKLKDGTQKLVESPKAVVTQKRQTLQQVLTTNQSSKQSVNSYGKKVTIQLNKTKTGQQRTNSHTSQASQNKSATRQKGVEGLEPNARNQKQVPQKNSKQSSNSKVPPPMTNSASKTQLSGKLGPPGSKSGLQTTVLKLPQTVTDLKHKVDKQAGILLEAIQRGNLNPGQESAKEAERIGPESFVAHQLLGNGSFGEVFLVERKQDRKLLAMKVLSKKKIKQQNLKKYAITERNVMCSMGEHPFIVQLRYAFQTREHLFLISDYCPGGDLSQYLEIEGCFEESKARLYVQEILLGIEALHKHNIIFRDLKPDNVIIDKTGHAMLTDFGLSRENVRRSEIGAKSFCGSYAYLAPEMLKKNGHGKAVDWYLLGVILFEMVTGLPPYYADDKDQLFKNIRNDTIDMEKVQTETSVTPECIDLMRRLLEKDPIRRLGTKGGAFEIRQHPFFRDTDWDTVFTRQLIMPEPYLANMAMDIIKAQPYLVAGHPHTVGDICPREHRSYLAGWSFTQPEKVGTESMLSQSEKLQLEDETLKLQYQQSNIK